MKIRKKEKLVISICMMIVVCFSLATATFAWYTNNDMTVLENLNLAVGNRSELKVEIAVEPGTRMDMRQVDGAGATIDLALSKLLNIEENKLGPGAFGEVHIYILAPSATCTGYTISITPNYDLIAEGNEEALELAKEHIRFYAAKTENGYAQLIPYKDAQSDALNGISGNLVAGQETEVVLYWYWPYEYEDVPDKTQITAENEREYDLQDTMIGNYIQSIGFTFAVEGKIDE